MKKQIPVQRREFTIHIIGGRKSEEVNTEQTTDWHWQLPRPSIWDHALRFCHLHHHSDDPYGMESVAHLPCGNVSAASLLSIAVLPLYKKVCCFSSHRRDRQGFFKVGSRYRRRCSSGSRRREKSSANAKRLEELLLVVQPDVGPPVSFVHLSIFAHSRSYRSIALCVEDFLCRATER